MTKMNLELCSGAYDILSHLKNCLFWVTFVQLTKFSSEKDQNVSYFSHKINMNQIRSYFGLYKRNQSKLSRKQ